jgi:hypothetical protein
MDEFLSPRELRDKSEALLKLRSLLRNQKILDGVGSLQDWVRGKYAEALEAQRRTVLDLGIDPRREWPEEWSF